MRNARRWVALIVAGLGLGQAGCQTWTSGLTLPSPRYLDYHYPQYFAPDPSFPLPRELASMQDPEGAARRGGVPGGAPAPVPPAATAPVLPGPAAGAPVGPGR